MWQHNKPTSRFWIIMALYCVMHVHVCNKCITAIAAVAKWLGSLPSIHRCMFESHQECWNVSCGELTKLVYRWQVVRSRCSLVFVIMFGEAARKSLYTLDAIINPKTNKHSSNVIITCIWIRFQYSMFIRYDIQPYDYTMRSLVYTYQYCICGIFKYAVYQYYI